MKDEQIIQQAIRAGSQEAYTAGGLRRDFSFNSAELLKFASGLVKAARIDQDLNTIFPPSSIKGHSAFDRLSVNERQELLNWMTLNPGRNGMDWPGWADVMQRESVH